MKAIINGSSPAENKHLDAQLTATPDRRKFNGGARIGAGRKSQNKVNMTFTINEDVAIAATAKFKGELSGRVEKFLKRISK